MGGNRSYAQAHVELRGGKVIIAAPVDSLVDLREVLMAFWGDLGIALGMLDDVLGGQPDRPPQLPREDLHGSLVGVPPLAPLPEDVGGMVAGDDRDRAPDTPRTDPADFDA